MEPLPYIGLCRVCGYGMLEIISNIESEKCSVICDECLAEWDTPENALKNIGGFRKSYEKAEARTATMEEIEEAGWKKYIEAFRG